MRIVALMLLDIYPNFKCEPFEAPVVYSALDLM